MGQSWSESTSVLYLHVLNCSSRTFWIQSINGWEEILPDHRLRSLETLDKQEVKVYGTDRSEVVTSVVMKNGDMLLYLQTRGAHFLKWPIKHSYQRPFYLIAHQVNDPSALHQVAYDGANACEIDLQFDPQDRQWYVNHDRPEGLTVFQWLQHLKSHTEFQVVIMDIKNPCPGWHLRLLLEQVRRTKIRQTVVFSVATELSCLLKVEHELHASEGLATDYVSLPEEVVQQLPSDVNAWFGDGITSWAPNKPGLYDALRKAVYLRTNGTKIKKVYTWTVATEGSFLKYLDLDLDGIMVEKDFVGAARALVERSPFHRMATLEDHPFQRSEVGCSALQPSRKARRSQDR